MLLPPRPPAPMMAMFNLPFRFCPRRNAGATSVPSAEVASSLEKCRRDSAPEVSNEVAANFVFKGMAKFYWARPGFALRK